MTKTNTAAAERLAFSISEFCQLVGISRSYFYTLPPEQRPREVCFGRRRLIPADAAREWLRSAAA
jgi:excisionase family DNA binding protein